MDNPKKLLSLWLILNFIFASTSNPITSELQPDIIVQANGKVCLLANLNIKFFDGSEEITIPENVKPKGSCYNDGGLNPEITYKWYGDSGNIKYTLVVRWKHDDFISYVQFVDLFVESEKTGELHVATFTDLKVLNVNDEYRWQCDEAAVIKNKEEPYKSVHFSGAYQVGNNLGYKYFGAQHCSNDDAEKNKKSALLNSLRLTEHKGEDGENDPNTTTSSTTESTTTSTTESTTTSSTESTTSSSTEPTTTSSTESTTSSTTSSSTEPTTTSSTESTTSSSTEPTTTSSTESTTSSSTESTTTSTTESTTSSTTSSSTEPTTTSSTESTTSSTTSSSTEPTTTSSTESTTSSTTEPTTTSSTESTTSSTTSSSTEPTTTSSTESTTSSTTESTTSSTTESTTSSTTESTTSSTTESTTSSTTESTTSSTTESTTETTTEPETTTTTEPETTTTTEAETTTTTEPETTETPTEPPSTDKPSFTVTDPDNKKCILASMKISITVPYEANVNGITINKTQTVSAPSGASFTGLCSGQNGTIAEDGEKVEGPLLIITWDWAGPKSKASGTSIPTKSNYVSVKFKTEDDETSIGEITPSITIDKSTFPDASKPGQKAKFTVSVDGYVADKGESYACSDTQDFSTDEGDGKIKLEDVKFQVGSDLSDTFAEGSDCNDSGDNTVAIAVGVTIAVLVVTVVGGFLYKRYRDKKK